MTVNGSSIEIDMSQSQKYCSYCGSCQERYYTVETAALMLECSIETVRYWIKERRIGSVKFGRLRRIPAHELDMMAKWFTSLEEALN